MRALSCFDTTTTIATVLSFTRITSASPVATHRLQNRSDNARNAGIDISIAISVIVSAAIIFYLGMRRGRSGSWLCWRDPDPSPPPLAMPMSPFSDHARSIPSRHRQIFSVAPSIQTVISTPVELSPVTARPRFPELPGSSLAHEIGGEQRNWFSGIWERRSWFTNTSCERRSWWRSRNNSLYEMEGSPVPPVPPLPNLPSSPPPTYQSRTRFSIIETPKEEKTMDWAEMEYTKKVFEG